MDKSNSVIIKNENFTNNLLSHTHLIGPEIFIDCCYQNSDMSCIRYEEVVFKGCDFSNADLSNSEFIDCDFIDCIFVSASLSNSVFSGCVIKRTDSRKDESPFDKASLSSSLFCASDNRRGGLSGILFKGISFRNLSFKKIDFCQCLFDGIPFEGAIFKECSFDKLDLTRGAIKGVQFDSCTSPEFYTILDKAFSIVGLFGLAVASKIEVYATSGSATVVASTIDQLGFTMLENIDVFISSASIYEFVNTLSFLSSLAAESPSFRESVASRNSILLTGNFHQDVTSGVDYFVEETAKAGRFSNLASINFAMNVFLYENCSSQEIINKVIGLVKIAKEGRYSFQNLSEVYLKFEKLRQKKTDDFICLTFVDSSCAGLSYSNTSEFSTLLYQIMSIIGASEYSIHSRTQGSIIEKIILKKSALLNSYPKLVSIIFLLGFQFEMHSSANGIDFRVEYKLNSSFTKPERELTPSEVKDRIIELRTIDRSLRVPSEEEISSLGSEIDNYQRLKEKLKSGEISISVEKATVNQITPQASSNIFLQNLPE